ncbi:uncharacterized protein LOC127244940 [Andrographis paniculata]|uniref:uncharacterized protein LOC127244940 n=1 Tax=Andrographis paniculata TaxID=175694 RepID=UPI0021E8D33F|nr:uncharacterized protein LOC127244940 [Andrographis paniculata]
MEESYGNLPASHSVGSVPAVVGEDSKTNQEVPGATLQTHQHTSAGSGGPGYQRIGRNNDEGAQQSSNNWKGIFDISSYTQYFNVDTDIVVNRLLSSLHPTSGDFVNKIDANPDLYGLVWISTTLVFLIASFGNCATYLMNKRSEKSISWDFDVSYVHVAAGSIYGYVIIVPLGYYFLLQYLGSSVSLIRFWCLWGYSLFILIPTSLLLVIPVEFLRWVIILAAGAASSSFIGLNLGSYIESVDLSIVAVSAFVLQMGLSIFIKVRFFP